MEEEMVRVGFDKGREEMEEISKWKQWMQRKVRMGGMEMSEMCREFYIWGL